MNDAFYVAATGMQTQQKNVETIANNLANINTPGFKKSKVSFADMVYREVSGAPALLDPVAAPSVWQGTGVSIASLAKVFTQGDLKPTGASMDLAIRGDGFMEVSGPDGQLAYSRGGSLLVDKEGLLCAAEGYQLKPAIHVGTSPAAIRIDADGKVTVTPADGTASFEAGRIELVKFPDQTGLIGLGNNLYRASDRSGDSISVRAGEAGMGNLAQGYLEGSNVSLVEEMVDLTVAQRAYESSVKVIQATDEMLAMSNNLRK